MGSVASSLTAPQFALLQQRHGTFAARYKPGLKLLELGLITSVVSKYQVHRFALTLEGERILGLAGAAP